MSTSRPIYECQPCGACCRNPDYNRQYGLIDYVQVFPVDQLFKLKGRRAELTQRNDEDEWHMRMTQDGHCIALEGTTGQHTSCGIYDIRPGVCRRVQPGDEKCIIARQERGLPI